MSSNCPIAWFEIVTEDFQRAITFYEDVFDIKLKLYKDPKMDMAVFPYEEGYPSGALVHGDCFADHKAGNTLLIYLTTDSVTKQLAKIEQHGGEEVFPVTRIGENGFIAGFKDSEGNSIGLWSQNQ